MKRFIVIAILIFSFYPVYGQAVVNGYELVSWPNAKGNIVIPDTIREILGSAFNGNSKITSVFIPKSVNTIYPNAFFKCTSLNTVKIGNETDKPTTKISIYSSAFSGCTNLKYLNINRDFFSEDRISPFKQMTSLDSISIGNQIPTISNETFSGCTELKKLLIGNKFSVLGDSITLELDAFYNCRNLKKIYLNKSIGIQGASSSLSPFYYLDSVYVDDSVRSLGNLVFCGCVNIKSVRLSNSLIFIGPGGFANCKKLQSIVLPNSLKKIEDGVFTECTELNSVTFGNQIIDIDDYAFIDCTNLEEVRFPNTLKRIGTGAFCRCASMNNLVINNSITTIDNGAFIDCTGLKTLLIGDSLKTINEYAFANCTNLASLTIPNSVSFINDNAFKGCRGLKSLTISGNSGDSEETEFNCFLYPFAECDSVTELTINKNIHDSDLSSPFIMFKSLTTINLGDKVTFLPTFAFTGCSALESFIIPNTINSIGVASFQACTNLKSIRIPTSITVLKNQTFMDCSSLKSIHIPNNITSLGNLLFCGCIGLESIVIPESVDSVGALAFGGCKALQLVWSKNPVPPVAGDKCFLNVPTSICPLYVPIGSKDAYQAANQWNNFTNIIEVDILASLPKMVDVVPFFIKNGELHINMAYDAPAKVRLVNFNSLEVWSGMVSGKGSIPIDDLTSGIYLLCVGDNVQKVMIGNKE